MSKKYTYDEMQEMRAYIYDFVEAFDAKELAQAVREDIISIEEIEDAIRRKMSI
jgi:hypothetical protein